MRVRHFSSHTVRSGGVAVTHTKRHISAAAIVCRRAHVVVSLLDVFAGQILSNATYGTENGDPSVNRLLQEGILCAAS